MNTQRDAILGYANEQHAYYIRFIENNTVLGNCYGLFCPDPESDDAENIMMTLFLKKSFWLNGSDFQNIVKGLQPLAVDSTLIA
ncbi:MULTISPECIES: hypothetical protein [Acinetobacter]|jgi:hypothetical protein|uniref:DdrR n=2 Tax=Acinetobacter TaxID=469 RepID=A0A1Z9Z1L1_9GAMM|nr:MULTISPECIES: hypothetical protein [Acinetobacter]MCH4246283.1 hypothetical protein [Acinetobacter populi]OUY08335.1 hypothetical protein CAP51_01545 [Acinetobacter populi]SNX43681.1 hypothetical protein SAMN05421731_101723 [Acinetobacter puyangensis]